MTKADYYKKRAEARKKAHKAYLQDCSAQKSALRAEKLHSGDTVSPKLNAIQMPGINDIEELQAILVKKLLKASNVSSIEFLQKLVQSELNNCKTNSDLNSLKYRVDCMLQDDSVYKAAAEGDTMACQLIQRLTGRIDRISRVYDAPLELQAALGH